MCLVWSQRAVVSVLVSHVCTEMCLFLLLMLHLELIALSITLCVERSKHVCCLSMCVTFYISEKN